MCTRAAHIEVCVSAASKVANLESLQLEPTVKERAGHEYLGRSIFGRLWKQRSVQAKALKETIVECYPERR